MGDREYDGAPIDHTWDTPPWVGEGETVGATTEDDIGNITTTGMTDNPTPDAPDEEQPKIEVAFKRGRDTYHLLDGGGEVFCGHVHARRGTDAALIRTVKADVENELKQCEWCVSLKRRGGLTRDDIVQEIHLALDTGRESPTFTKDELLRILDVVSPETKA